MQHLIKLLARTVCFVSLTVTCAPDSDSDSDADVNTWGDLGGTASTVPAAIAASVAEDKLGLQQQCDDARAILRRRLPQSSSAYSLFINAQEIVDILDRTRADLTDMCRTKNFYRLGLYSESAFCVTFTLCSLYQLQVRKKHTDKYIEDYIEGYIKGYRRAGRDIFKKRVAISVTILAVSLLSWLIYYCYTKR